MCQVCKMGEHIIILGTLANTYSCGDSKDLLTGNRTT